LRSSTTHVLNKFTELGRPHTQVVT